MKLKCRIHEKDYDIVSGATFSEEYNETLDSGSIIIDHIPKIEKLRPFDDVYIWNSDEEFNGYSNVGDEAPVSLFGGFVGANIWTTASEEDWQPRTSAVAFSSSGGRTSLAGKIISLWNYLRPSGGQDDRWKIQKITLQLSLTEEGSNSSYTGYYKIGLSNSDVAMSTHLIFTKDAAYAQNSNLPSRLLIGFEAATPEYAPSGEQSDPALFLDNLALEATSTGSGDAWSIISAWSITGMSLPSGEAAVTYYENESATSRIIVSITGMTDAQVSAISNISMPIVIEGETAPLYFDRYLSFDLSHGFAWMHFVAYVGANGGTASYALRIDKNHDGAWYGSGSFLLGISAGGTTTMVHADAGGGDLSESALLTVSSSTETPLPTFFKHMLVDSFTCDMVDFDDENEGRAVNYKYKIDLMSETKRLEKTILPNVSITQPIVGQKRTVWYYLNQYVRMYSPKIKMISNNGEWKYVSKFKIDQRNAGDGAIGDEYIDTPVREIFDDSVYAPEMSLTAPTLREALSRLMIVKDCIPVVRNDVVYAMRISDVHGTFRTDGGNFSFRTESMNSVNYSTALRREYGGAISQKNSAHMVEYLGFRNKDNALMTLDNMYLETRFPIYKINKLEMCYYKSFHIENTETGDHYEKLVLITHDISHLVLQNAVRDALPADWTKIGQNEWDNITIAEMSNYRLLTLGYDIGSTRIAGWGEKFSYKYGTLAWFTATYTYIEMIVGMLDQKSGYLGDGGLQFLGADERLDPNYSGNIKWDDIIVSPNNSGSITDALKSLFFKMDYTAMYSGAIIHSKDNTDDDDAQTSDNCSSALSVLEADGLFQREKANRIANAEYGFIARFSDVFEMEDDLNDVIGAAWDMDPNVIIFHKEYQIFDDCVLANFSGTVDYVMKNYFTTVFAKYRTYSYASYSESVNRAENDKTTIVLSDDTCLYEEEANSSDVANIRGILSALSESEVEQDFSISSADQVNGGYFEFSDGSRYYSDVNQFVSGYSLCFNIRTFGSITNGNHISSINCYDDGENEPSNGNAYVGSLQEWYKMPVADNDGFLEKLGCYFGHFDDGGIIRDNEIWGHTTTETDDLFSDIFALPEMNRTPTFSFGKMYDMCKDDKEIIDFTLQYELVNQDEDVVASEWMMKLTNFNGYPKLSTEREVFDKSSAASTPFAAYFGSEQTGWNLGLFLLGYDGKTYKRRIRLRINSSDASEVQSGVEIGECRSSPYFTSTRADQSGSASYQVRIALSKIDDVTRDANQSITSIRIKAIYTQNSTVTHPSGYVSKDERMFTDDITFSAEQSDDPGALLFIYEGDEIPGMAESIYKTAHNNSSVDSATPVYGGMLSSSARYVTFPKTMYIVKSTKAIERSMMYAQYGPYDLDDSTDLPSPGSDLPSWMSIIDVSPKGAGDGETFEDVLSIRQDENGLPYIEFGDADILGDDYESVQYWYYDANGDGYMHFVMGINRTKEQGGAKIYISMVKNRGKDVYNGLHRATAEVMNFAEDGNEGDYGRQLYVEKGDE